MIRGKRAFYEKLPVTIIAFQWLGHDPEEPENDLVRYFRRPDVSGEDICTQCDNKMHYHGWIDTLEGGHNVCPRDWIIKGVAGEFYPCKPQIFEATYKKIQDDPKEE